MYVKDGEGINHAKVAKGVRVVAGMTNLDDPPSSPDLTAIEKVTVHPRAVLIRSFP